MVELKELTKRYEKLALVPRDIDKGASSESTKISLVDSALSGIAASNPVSQRPPVLDDAMRQDGGRHDGKT